MAETVDYKELLTEIIKKQVVILGPDIAISQAKSVSGINVSEDGTVTEVGDNPQKIVQDLIDKYVSLSGLIVKEAMKPLLAKYPSLKIEQ